MAVETVTRTHLIEAACREAGATRSDATMVFDTLLETIGKLLNEKGEVKVPRFGAFVTKEKSARVGRNPKTGEEVAIPAHNAVSFKPAQNLKTEVEKLETAPA